MPLLVTFFSNQEDTRFVLRAKSQAKQMRRCRSKVKQMTLGNGYFMLKLESKDDMVRIWSQVWRVENQICGFNKWSPDFDPGKQRSTNMLLWVRFPFLQQQYWPFRQCVGRRTLGKALGNPIGIDQRTLQREYGHFANVLVDIDLAKPVPQSIKVKEEDGRNFKQIVEIPKLPSFCSHCKLAAHEITECRILKKLLQNSEQRVGSSEQGEDQTVIRNESQQREHGNNTGRGEGQWKHISEAKVQNPGRNNFSLHTRSLVLTTFITCCF